MNAAPSPKIEYAADLDQPAPSPNSCGVVDEILRLLRECRESQVEAIKHLEKKHLEKIKPWRPTP